MKDIYCKYLKFYLDCGDGFDFKRYYARPLNSSFLNKYDPNDNKFTPTIFTDVLEFCIGYYKKYHTAPTVAILTTETTNNAILTEQEKQNIYDIAIDIKNETVLDKDFDFIFDKVKSEFVKNSIYRFGITSIKEAETKPISTLNSLVDHSIKLKNSITVGEEDVNSKSVDVIDAFEIYTESVRNATPLQGTPVPYGFDDWDELLGGLYPGELVVFVGSTGVGKSWVSHEIAYMNAIDLQKKVVIVDLEMLFVQTMHRLVSRQTQIPINKLKQHHTLTPEEIQLVEDANTYIKTNLQKNNVLIIPPERAKTIDMIKLEIDSFYGSDVPDLILVDYIDEVEVESGSNRADWENKNEITKLLKKMAINYRCPVISLTQFNAQGMQNSKAELKDMSYKGISKKADIVIGLYEDPNDPPTNDTARGCGTLIAKFLKNRNDFKPTFRLGVNFSTASIQNQSDGEILITNGPPSSVANQKEEVIVLDYESE